MILPATNCAEAAKTVTPFTDNVEFLHTKSQEALLLLERASLIRNASSPGGNGNGVNGSAQGRVHQQWLPAVRMDSANGDGTSDALDDANGRLTALRELTCRRLERSGPATIPFVSLVRKFDLDEVAQDVIWLLFFKATSPEFRQKFRKLQLADLGGSGNDQMCVGDILSVLYPGDYRSQLAARGLFGSERPLMGRYLLRAPFGTHDRFSILELDLILSTRIIHWITADKNQYAAEMPFTIDRPKTELSQVVLPGSVIDPVLRLVERYDEYVGLRKSIGMDSVIDYGRAVVILEYGPPGTGKTLLARAISNHIGRPLISLPCDSDAGPMPPRMRAQKERESLSTLFREGQLQNGIVFIDECEDICHKDSPYLKEFLVELEKSEALVIMTTNKPGKMAPSVDRRITLKVPFEVPSSDLRQRIWELLLSNGVPLANDVDLGYLARTYPFAGGYIKNAVLTALNIALSRSLDHAVLITQADLEEAAQFQERHLGPYYRFRQLATPQLRLDDCVVSTENRGSLERLVRMIGNHRDTLTRWGWEHRRIRSESRGVKVLFYGSAYETALEAAEAIAGELSVRVNRLPFTQLIRMRENPEKYGIDEGYFSMADVFATFADSDNVLLLSDNFGNMGRLLGRDEPYSIQEFFQELGAYEGVVIVATCSKHVKLPEWASVFHETLRFTAPDVEARSVYWRQALNRQIPLADDVDPCRLAAAHTLGYRGIRAAVHKACLLKAADDPDGRLDARTIDEAARFVGKNNMAGEVLFG